MLDLFFVSNLVEAIYGFSPTTVEPLQRYSFDWRGIFGIREDDGQRWVLRLIRHPEAARNFYATAVLLDWLKGQDYTVPDVHRTRDGQLVGIRNGWTMLLLSFVEGELITPVPSNLRLLSAQLGQLHGLHCESAPALRFSRCHPDSIATHTLPQLRSGSQSIPEAYTSLVSSMLDSMNALIHVKDLSLAITHGDCWYMNAIKSEAHQVHLIDWDNVGLGAALLDLGYLLLSSHFRLEEPWVIEPEEATIQAIMEGYQRSYPLNHTEVRCFLPAVHFLLAYQLGEYCENNAIRREGDLFLVKLQHRFRHAATIARMAEMYVEVI